MQFDDRWGITILILFLFGMVSFLVAVGLGLFIGGGILTTDIRERIVGGWMFINSITTFFVIINRHAFR